MSFSRQIKTELCNLKLSCKACRLALVYGMILGSKTTTDKSVHIITESRAVADLFTQAVVELTSAIVTIKNPDIRERTLRPTYSVMLENENDIHSLFNMLSKNNIYDENDINYTLIRNNCCKIAFLRGIYLTCGTVIDPLKEYHIEFSFRNENLCYLVSDMLYRLELDFKITSRGKNLILYAKESQQIEDILTILGAVKATMDLMNLKIEKDLRNIVNRRTNCETANISKTVNASITQVSKIELISLKIGLDKLPIELKEIARLRLANPESSLSELCELMPYKISRSGINHRLKKLCDIADKL